MKTPEEKLLDFANRIHLQDSDVDYLLSLLLEARGLGLQFSRAELEKMSRENPPPPELFGVNV